MESRVLSVDDVLRERQRWCVPVYQRHYAWDVVEDGGQLTRLWEDIGEKANESLAGGRVYPHYIGAIIVAEPPNQPFGTVRQRLLVDGQQRITTFQLVLAAIREVAHQQKNENLIPVIDAYLFNALSGGMSQTLPQIGRVFGVQAIRDEPGSSGMPDPERTRPDPERTRPDPERTRPDEGGQPRL